MDNIITNSPTGENPADVPSRDMSTHPTDDAFCTQPAEIGRCRAAIPAWHWDDTAQECKSFIFGGCEGNDNLFETKEACIASSEQFCRSLETTLEISFPDLPADATFCTQPAERGDCRASLEAWYWNDAAKECDSFIFGGCAVNNNVFETQTACTESSEKFCSSSTARGGIYALILVALALAFV